MKFDEGRVFGARYYTVEPVGGNWWEMECWCFDTFGVSEGAFEPSQRWYMNDRKFWFREKKDLEWFVVRWA